MLLTLDLYMRYERLGPRTKKNIIPERGRQKMKIEIQGSSVRAVKIGGERERPSSL